MGVVFAGGGTRGARRCRRRRISASGLAIILVAILSLTAAAVRADTAAVRAGHPATTVLRLADAAPVQAFLDSVGINTHWLYRDTPYGAAYGKVRDLLVASGIRHVRDAWNPRIPDLAAHGIGTTVITGPADAMSLAALRAKISALMPTGAIDAVEGPNEPDLASNERATSFEGERYPKSIATFQRVLYRTFKSDPRTAALPVVGFSLGTTFDPGAGHGNPFGRGTLAGVVDFGNFHPYPFNGNPFSPKVAYGTLRSYYHDGDPPSVNIDRYPYAFDVYAPPFAPKPMVASETGYSTSPSGTSEALQAKYIPRLFAEYFRRGIRRTDLYALIDDDAASGGKLCCFGIIRRDLTPKPAYFALQSLLTTLRSGLSPPEVAAFPPPPDDSVTIRAWGSGAFSDPTHVHALLLRSGARRFTLLVWDAVSGEDCSTTPRRPIDVPDLPAVIGLPAAAHAVELRRYAADWRLERIPAPEQGTKISLAVPDSIVVLTFAL